MSKWRYNEQRKQSRQLLRPKSLETSNLRLKQSKRVFLKNIHQTSRREGKWRRNYLSQILLIAIC